MSAVSDYAFINANLRGKLSQILSLDFLLDSATAKDLYTLLANLKDTPFDYLADIYHRTADIKSCEKALKDQELQLIKYLYKNSPKGAKNFAFALASKYEIENIKQIIRLWFDLMVRGRSIDKITPYLNRETVLHTILVDPILNAQAASEVVKLFSLTPYYEIFKNHFEEAVSDKTLYNFETQLDRHYYSILVDSLSTLNVQDKKIATKYVGTLIDIENLNQIVRLSYYFKFSKEQIVNQIIQGGNILNQTAVKKITSQDELEAIEILKSYYGKYLEDLSASNSKDYLFSALLKIQTISLTMLEEMAFKALTSEPFSIGVMIAYLIKKTLELRRIATLINAKYYNIPYAQLKELL